MEGMSLETEKTLLPFPPEDAMLLNMLLQKCMDLLMPIGKRQ